MNIKLLILLLCLLTPIAGRAQTGRLFTVDKELSSSLINCIYQDKDGIIWIGTEDGLNRYDGAKFTIYKHDKGDPHSLRHNYVRCLFEDSHGRCFVSTLGGLQSYDAATDCFTDIPLITSKGEMVWSNVGAIMERRNGSVLIGTSGKGLFKITETEQGIIALQQDEMPANSIISMLHEDRGGNFWLITDTDGLYRIDKDHKKHKYMTEVEAEGIALINLYEDEQGIIYIGTLGRGIYHYDTRRDTCEPIPYPANPQLPVKALYQVSPNEIYIGTDGYGMKVYDIAKQQIIEPQLTINTFDLDKSKVHSILKDRAGNLWLGFFQKGVLLVPATSDNFHYIGYKSVQRDIIGSNCVMSLYKGHDNQLWVGTDNNGLYRVDESLSSATHFATGRGANDAPSTILSIFEDSHHNIWLGSYMQGIAKLDPKTGACRYIKAPINLRVYAFAEDRQNRLWIATMGKGLYYMDLDTEQIFHYQDEKSASYEYSDWITSLHYSPSNRIYMGTYNGINCLDLNTMQLTTMKGTKSLFYNDVIYALYEDADGILWAGSSDGLKSFNPHTDETVEYATTDGLPSNVVCAITTDRTGNLWLSTNYGLSRFSPQEKSFVCYYANDGLQGNEFSKNAIATDDDGNILFGGINGITYFHPADIRETTPSSTVHITGFYLHNQNVKKGILSGGKPVIECAVMDADTFRLCHKDNSFSIEFSSMEFANPERITYTYCLNRGQWITLQPGVKRVTFSDLLPGTYHFRVKGKDYNTFTEERAVTIIIAPAWYASWWAKLIYIVLAGILVYLAVMQIRHRYRVRQELQEHVHAEQLNEAKLQFFINVSHEIRTPLTLITSPLQKLMSRDKDAERQQEYHTMYRNTQRLLMLMNQLMDIRKIDKGQMVLKFQEVEMVSFIRDVSDSFAFQASSKHIRLSFVPDVPELYALIDSKHFDTVLINVLSNAFKFTGEGGEINIYLHPLPEENIFEIVVEDNGTGIDEKEIDRIFDRFYQASNNIDNAGVGTGIGLHLTRSLVNLHHGTIRAANNTDKPGCHFTITLPMVKKQPQQEEVAANKKHKKTRFRILVVEDDDEIRKYICHELSEKFHTSECHNGKEAWEQVLTQTPDLLISDVMMPEMDGFTLCRKIRQNININHLPIILLTAKTTEEDNLQGLELGADAYITKPFSIDILCKTVESLLKRHELMRHSFSGEQEQTDKMKKLEVKSPDEELMDRIMKVINRRLDDKGLTVNALAEEVGISRVHLNRKLHEMTSQSPSDFVRNIRLQQAAALLAEKRYNINEVAQHTGFSGVSYFSNAFKERYGLSPSEYMEKKKEEKTEENHS